MNRNTNEHFAINPVSIDLPRSRFTRNFENIGTCNTGQLIPFFWDEVIPGSTHSIDTAKVVRMQTPMFPFMDNMYMDTYYFFVPMRLIWEHWQEFLGENNSDAWVQTVNYTIPQITSPSSTGWTMGTIADYMGIPIGKPGQTVSALPFRAYALVCNDWFRSEVLTAPLNIPRTDSTQTGSNGSSYVNDVANGGMPFVVSKSFDVFTGALPAPQKADAVTISLAGDLPVVGNGYNLALSDGTNLSGLYSASTTGGNRLSALTGGAYGQQSPASSGTASGISNAGGVGVPTKTLLGDNLEYSGLIALGDNIDVITVNQLRDAFQVQKIYEKMARGGTRYVELLRSMWGTRSADSRLQRPEYIGGNRLQINVNQVVSTSETNDRPQGSTAAYSLTTDYHSDFSYSATEHGILLGVFCIRYNHSYQQGINRMWLHKNKFDIYWPTLANIGEVGIKNQEIYSQGSSVVNASTGKAYDDEIFGYQEAWYEYRYKNSIVSGEMRSDYSASLDVWHLADDYSSLPALSDPWIREDKSNVDRVLAVSSGISHQFLFDFYVKDTVTAPMPLYSIPGLIDHH